MRIKNWKKFQHFKNRRPPWIKLYRELLDDPKWHELTGEDAKFLVMLWLLASEDEALKGYLPDIKAISFRLRMSEEEIEQRFQTLDEWLCDDINVTSEGYQDDTPETEGETYKEEKETETEEANPPLNNGVEGQNPESAGEAAKIINKL